MELVYLWVEKYKNIEKQGFNFSPSFDVKFTPVYKNEKLSDKSELKITTKENPLKDFFGEKIFINAIIGKNGSGKTSLLTLLAGGIFDNPNNAKKIKNLFILYFLENRFLIFKFFDNNLESFRVYSDKNYEFQNLYKNIEKKDYEINEILKINYFLLMDFSIGQLDFFNDSRNGKYKTEFALEPSRNYRSSGGPAISTKIEPTSFDANMRSNILYLYKYLSMESIKNLNLPSFDKIVYYGKRRMGENIKNEFFRIIKDKKVILGIDFTNCQNTDEISQKISEYFNSNQVFIKDIDENELENFQILVMFADMGFRTSDDSIGFWELSTGQKQLISYMGIIIRTIHERLNNSKTLTLIIDEIETSLHPQWQKEFVKLLLNFVEIIKEKINNIQIILAGHSPFIVSDLPKGNIIFLKDCKQVSGIEKKETFGANIHTLLADSFFVEAGLIGEFAKDKISQILFLLSNKIGPINIPTEQIKPIIEIIGEDFLREKLLKMYNEKFPPSKEERIKKLKEELERLENDKSKI
ncbi:AAA family ATPase [Aliarcobacter butzleri]